MKRKELTDIKGKTLKELRKMVFEKKLEVGKIKVETPASKGKNLKASKNLRRQIAQILTIIKEKEIVERIQKQ